MHLQVRKWLLCLALLFCQVYTRLALEKPPATEVANLVVTGSLVCLDGAFKEKACGTTPEILGLRTAGGKVYPLKKHENVDALFVEKRLQTREFRLTLRKEEASSPWFELVKAQFIRGGKVYDFHYFCEAVIILSLLAFLFIPSREPTE